MVALIDKSLHQLPDAVSRLAFVRPSGGPDRRAAFSAAVATQLGGSWPHIGDRPLLQAGG